MSKTKILLMAIVVTLVFGGVSSAGEGDGLARVDNLSIDIWLNKAEGSTYYYGEDVAIYFQTDEDCYVVVYDIDPAGNVSMLYPADSESSCFVKGGEQYRIPDVYDDYRLEVTGPGGPEYIYAVATSKPISAPDFIKYEFFDYGDWDYYYDDFVHSVRGEREAFATDLNRRIVDGPLISTSTMFYIDENYRNNRWYRHWSYDPYYVGSVWIGADYPGCEIWIDGIYYGIAPLLIPEIYIGRHWVWIYYHGFPCWQDYVYVRSGQRFYVDAKINRGRLNPSDGHKYLRDWRFKYDKYPNEPDFKHKAEIDRVKHSRPRLQPPINVIDKYSKKSVNRENYLNKEKERSEYREVIKNSDSPKTEDRGLNRRRDSEQNGHNKDLKIEHQKPIIKDEPSKEQKEEPKKETSKSNSGKSSSGQKSISGSKSSTGSGSSGKISHSSEGKESKRGRK